MNRKIVQTIYGIFIGQKQGDCIKISIPARTSSSSIYKTEFLDLPLMDEKTYDNFIESIVAMKELFIGINKDNTVALKFSPLGIGCIELLKKIAIKDQSLDVNRPWNYTDECHMCGGVKAFFDWLEKNIKEEVKP